MRKLTKDFAIRSPIAWQSATPIITQQAIFNRVGNPKTQRGRARFLKEKLPASLKTRTKALFFL
jgi:hypothetical protein